MRYPIISFLLVTLGALPTHAVELPGGAALAAAGDTIDLSESALFPDGIVAGGTTYDTLYVSPLGVVTLGQALPPAVTPRPLAQIRGLYLIAPLWSLPGEACPAGMILHRQTAEALTITWLGAPILGCNDEPASFAVELRPGDPNGLSVTFSYATLPPGRPDAQPRAGLILGDTRVELLGDEAHAPGDRAKALRDRGSDGEAGVWVIELDGNDRLLADDGDGVRVGDNCEGVANPWQVDTDRDEVGDMCDPDDDNDRILDGRDNCPIDRNTDQSDIDGDRVGDVCDDDMDGDGLLNPDDLCPSVRDAARLDLDDDGIGDACDLDVDGDGLFLPGIFPYPVTFDRCPYVSRSNADIDKDGLGDACDRQARTPCRGAACLLQSDADGDGVLDSMDRCPTSPDPRQADRDGDGIGDACDPDANGDGLLDYYQRCIGCIIVPVPAIISP